MGVASVTSLTPPRPRETNERRKAPRKAPSSLGPTSRPSASRSPVLPLTPMAITTATETTRSSWRAFT